MFRLRAFRVKPRDLHEVAFLSTGFVASYPQILWIVPLSVVWTEVNFVPLSGGKRTIPLT